MTRPEDPTASLSSFERIPDDVLANIFARLDLVELLQLQQLSRTLNHRVEELGIPRYLTSHPQSHSTLYPPQTSSTWTPKALVQHNKFITSSLRHRKWQALQIGPTWRQPVIPTLTLSSDRLVLGVGGRILIHPLIPSSPSSRTRAAGRGREYMIAPKGSGSGTDIVGTVDLGDDQIGIAQYDGTLQRFKLHPNGRLESTAHYAHPADVNVDTLVSTMDGLMMMTTTNTGRVSLFRTRSPWIPPDTFTTTNGTRAWSSLITTSQPSLPPSIFLGITGGVSIHSLLPTGPESAPRTILRGPELPSRSSPYDLCLPPSPSAHHPSLLLSSWFDSYLRLHDLRTPSKSPIMELSDPWQWADGSAIYSCAFVGETHVAGGGARHGSVSLFDIRQPKTGWSVFSPGGKGSPVYSLKGEGGRIWGVTERRAFMIAFDGSGSEREGMVLQEARAPRPKVQDRPSGWKGRGGKWGWTVRYDEEEGCTGYDHSQRGVALFDSRPVV